jgi:hypothetical protein
MMEMKMLNRVLAAGRKALIIGTLGASAILATACHDTLYYGEATGFNLAVKLNDNPQSPVEANAGLKRRVLEVAPPVAVAANDSGHDKAAGEAASSFSGFRLKYTEDGIFGKLRIRTQFATGAAAIDLADQPAAVAQVVQADFKRKPDFVSSANRQRVSSLVGKVSTLDDGVAIAVACSPPLPEDQVKVLEGKGVKMPDEFCQPGAVPTAPAIKRAKAMLRIQIQEGGRTSETFGAWEAALGQIPAAPE